jgi:ribosomal protein S18 acetylase RimI-like enzyme
MIQLNLLKSDHMADVLRIQDYCYTEIEPELLESLQAKILASPNTCLIAESSEGAVGYLIAVPIIYPHLTTLNAPTFELSADADTLYIHDLAIDSTGRGKGVAQALVRASIDAAKRSGLSRACLVAIQNSQRFWEQFGFETVAEPADDLRAKLASYGADAQLMRAWLK